ncbi:MAG: hypothetical protein KJ923_05795 [Candidatus Omnitrophica bacterium]|nr:hypothetical protein [Candidatus Omnitrophota bacterium]MBU1906493.1 hypothetical protein [Candidatus Omnitrophota bacterium]
MGKKRCKYTETYKNCEIFIYGFGKEWWWKAAVHDKSRSSPMGYFSVSSALHEAKKYVDKKAL